MVAMAGPDSTAILNESGSGTSSGSWSLCKHIVVLAEPGGGITHWATPNSLVGEGGSDWVVNTLGSLGWGIQTSPSPKLLLWGLCLGPLNEGGICPVATMGLEGCSTFSQPGNLFRGLFSTVGSMIMSMVASFTGGLANVGGALSLVASSGVITGVSSRRAMPLNTFSSEKEM